MSKTTFQGMPVNIQGEFIQAGVKAPDFSLVKGDLSRFTLADGKGKNGGDKGHEHGLADSLEEIPLHDLLQKRYIGLTEHTRSPPRRSRP